MKKATGLGRGLSALIDESIRPARNDDAQAGVREIDIALIRPGATQPRVRFDEEGLADLARSIAERGVLQPILVRPSGDGFEIVAGERRWRAAQQAQLHRIPALVRTLDDTSSAEIALIENVQREDLSPIEEAEGYLRLIEAFGHTQDAVSKLVGKSRSHVANLLRLLALPDTLREMLLDGSLTMGHARAIATCSDAEDLARIIVERGLTVRQAEALAKKVRPGAGRDIGRASARNFPSVDADLAALERQLGDMLGLKVRVSHGKGGGNVVLHYSSLDQLDLICQRLSGEPI